MLTLHIPPGAVLPPTNETGVIVETNRPRPLPKPMPAAAPTPRTSGPRPRLTPKPILKVETPVDASIMAKSNDKTNVKPILKVETPVDAPPAETVPASLHAPSNINAWWIGAMAVLVLCGGGIAWEISRSSPTATLTQQPPAVEQAMTAEALPTEDGKTKPDATPTGASAGVSWDALLAGQ